MYIWGVHKSIKLGRCLYVIKIFFQPSHRNGCQQWWIQIWHVRVTCSTLEKFPRFGHVHSEVNRVNSESLSISWSRNALSLGAMADLIFRTQGFQIRCQKAIWGPFKGYTKASNLGGVGPFFILIGAKKIAVGLQTNPVTVSSIHAIVHSIW